MYLRQRQTLGCAAVCGRHRQQPAAPMSFEAHWPTLSPRALLFAHLLFGLGLRAVESLWELGSFRKRLWTYCAHVCTARLGQELKVALTQMTPMKWCCTVTDGHCHSLMDIVILLVRRCLIFVSCHAVIERSRHLMSTCRRETKSATVYCLESTLTDPFYDVPGMRLLTTWADAAAGCCRTLVGAAGLPSRRCGSQPTSCRACASLSRH